MTATNFLLNANFSPYDTGSTQNADHVDIQEQKFGLSEMHSAYRAGTHVQQLLQAAPTQAKVAVEPLLKLQMYQ